MKVTELMTPDAYSSQPNAALRSAIQMMRARRCGALPVIDADHHVVGIVTDRDAALAIGDADLPPSELTVDAAMTAAPYTCKAEDSVHRALDLMRRARVRITPPFGQDRRCSFGVVVTAAARSGKAAATIPWRISGRRIR